MSTGKPSYELEGRELIAEAPGLRVQVLTLGPGQCVPWHRHTSITDTFFCLEGPVVITTREPDGELRLMPRWDPFRNWPVIRNWPWRWWQVAVFGEIGRVAPSYRLEDLHEDLKWSAGAGLRIMLGGAVVRIDLAASDESSQLWVMARHAF